MNDIWETEGMNEGGFAGYMQPRPGVTGSVPHAFSPPTLQTPTTSSHDHWELGQAEQRLADSIAGSQSQRGQWRLLPLLLALPSPAASCVPHLHTVFVHFRLTNNWVLKRSPYPVVTWGLPVQLRNATD